MVGGERATTCSSWTGRQHPPSTALGRKTIFWERGASATIHSPTHYQGRRLRGAKRREAGRRSIAFTWIRQSRLPGRFAPPLNTGMPTIGPTISFLSLTGIKQNLTPPFRQCHPSISVFRKFIPSEDRGMRVSDRSLFRIQREHRAVPDVQDVHRLLNHYEKETISAPVADAEQQFSYRFAKRSTLRSQWTAFRMMGKSLDALPRSSDPVAGRTRCIATNVKIDCPKISLGFRSEDDAVGHLRLQGSRSSSSNTSSANRPSPFRAWARPRRMLATASR